ncbi:PriCT-2 domain-containing protein [Faecalibaculum rodentium]|uniref:PriCT-2 domain-containing protein n=1 Tax=Faecalibaculum rodentium TaxID=1702221 RepID=UPI002730677C|nr:PriCT-2 domain-containing protein [Faecalibaculum rodentium]
MEFDYQKILDCIPPSCTDRNQWVQVGMALKQEGQPFEMFDRGSAGDSRPNQYRGSEVTRKVWDSFKNSGSGTVTGATLTQMARDLGADPFPASDGFMDWGDEITSDGVEPFQKTVRAPRPDKSRKDVFQIVDYLEAVFHQQLCG